MTFPTLRSPRLLFAIIGALMIFGALQIGGVTPRADALTNCSVSDSVDSQEQAFLTLINDYRVDNGRQPLSMSTNLNRAAAWMAVDMPANNYFSHTDSLGRSPSTRVQNCGFPGNAGENIAAGTYRDTAQEAFDAWQASAAHNAGMLNTSYVKIGIARHYNAGSTYKWYWVTDFSATNDGTTVGGTPTPVLPTPTPVPPTPTPTPPAWSVAWGSQTTATSMTTAQQTTASVSFTNNGSQTWIAGGSNPVRLSYHWRNGACGGSSSAVWDGLRTALPGNVAPGNSVSNLTAQIRAPFTAGTYCLVYDLVREGVTWFSSQGASTLTRTVNVSAPTYGIFWSSVTAPSSMNAGATGSATLSFTNTGSLTWSTGGSNPVRIAYHWRNGACPGTSSANFDGVRTTLPGTVAPGASVNNRVTTVVAPNSPGTYCLQFDLVREGVTWFSWQGAPLVNRTVTVN